MHEVLIFDDALDYVKLLIQAADVGVYCGLAYSCGSRSTLVQWTPCAKHLSFLTPLAQIQAAQRLNAFVVHNTTN